MAKFATAKDLLDHLLGETAFERADLDDVVANHTKEGLHLDYKAGALVDEKGKDGLRTVVREYVSAFANSDGGVLVLGVTDPVVEARADAWCTWAAANDVDGRVIEYVRVTPKAMATPDGNPRAWTYASDIIKAWEQVGTGDSALLRAGLMGVLNASLGTSLASYVLNQEAPLTADDVIEGYDQARARVHRWSNAARIDLLSASWENLRQHLQAQRHYDALVDGRDNGDWRGCENVEAFIRDFASRPRRARPGMVRGARLRRHRAAEAERKGEASCTTLTSSRAALLCSPNSASTSWLAAPLFS